MKIIGTIILILALIVAIPPVRKKAGEVAMPVLEKLGPVGAWVINPLRKMGAKSKVKHVASLIDSDLQQGRKTPTERDFTTWLKRRSAGDSGMDPWGQPLWMEETDLRITIGSSGPDEKPGTADDITAAALK